MKLIITCLIFLSILTNSISQISEHEKIYDPEANARNDLKNAIIEAGKTNKHIFVQIGGNWCPWCIKFHNFINETPKLDSLLTENYIILRINYSREKMNEDILHDLQFPQRFGFPVFVILNSEGKLLHTQDSGFLEKDKSYDINKVSKFLKSWTVSALNPDNYKTD